MAGDVSLVEVMARLVAAFAMIIGLLGGAVYVFRRRGMIRVTGGVASSKRMKVVERQTLSRGSSIALVRVGTSSYLVGSTDQHVSMLADVTETVTASEALETSAAEAAEDDPARQGTGTHAGQELLHSPRMDLVGAILQRMNRRV
jgi:flagellar protein FliO/FliZ